MMVKCIETTMSPIFVSEFLCRNPTESLVGNALSFDKDATTVALRGLFRILWKKFYASKYHKGVNQIIGIRN